jgi:zinc transport system substrate-binding protein
MSKIKIIFIYLSIVFLLCGCTKDKSKDVNNSISDDSSVGTTIVTSFYPIYISTINIARDIEGVKVINMTKPQTGCLHDYQLTPENLITLEKADVFIINGAGMETFMDKVIKEQKDLKIINASEEIDIFKMDNGEENPHVWVSISNVITQVRTIEKKLCEIDVSNAHHYEKNANSYIEKLETLREKMHDSLEKVETRDIITFHEAFPYFAQEFKLNIVSVIEREPGTMPSPKEIEGIIEVVKKYDIKVLFAEPQYSSKVAEIIAQETGAIIYNLDPAVTGELKADGYIDIMEKNLEVLEEALN